MGVFKTLIKALAPRLPLFFLLVLPLGGESFKAAAVQMEVSRGLYASREAFWAAVEEPLSRAAEGGADLVIFPEYLGVFYSLIPYQDSFAGAEEVSAALDLLSRQAGRKIALPELFRRGGPLVEAALVRWASLARRYGLTLVAGTFFVPVNRGDGMVELRNRSYVFSPAGELLYRQDKVFLTDFEKDLAGLSPGTMEEAVGFPLGRHRVLLTICRDTYFPLWEDWYKNRGTLWIDIKANGEVFDKAQERSFRRALPSRLGAAGIPYGVTVCLVGTYMDLLWQGRSSFLANDSRGITPFGTAESAASAELILRDIP